MEDIDQHRISRILGSTMTPIERPRFGNFGLLGTMGESLRVRPASAEAGKGFQMTREKPDLDGPDLEDIQARLSGLERFAADAARDIRTLLEALETERNTAAAMLEAINALHGARTDLLAALEALIPEAREAFESLTTFDARHEARVLLARAEAAVARATGREVTDA